MLLKSTDLSLDQKIWEFDFWVTPSIVDIRATDRFKLEMSRVANVLEALSCGGHKELDNARYAADLVDRVIAHLNTFPDPTDVEHFAGFAEDFLVSLSALLFLVTGKSDNNNKCQFPIYLRNQVGWETIPTLKSKRGTAFISEDAIPRVLDSGTYMARVAKIHVAAEQNDSDVSLKDVAPGLLFQFANSLLADEPSREQLSAYLYQFSRAKAANEDSTVLLRPLVMFQVRGSVSASGGHEPEELLRIRMSEWGMIRETDFNCNDVILDLEAGVIRELNGTLPEEKIRKTKTRAYDFVLPFRTPTWHPMIFIQSQFYAGDSGSVSHKNVDQTQSSRQNATRLSTRTWPDSPPPVFLEYVDGAGYSASLNGDLKSLLSFGDTANFFQIRSASIRLRRELQKIGFLTPLEIGHAVVQSSGNYEETVRRLTADGYSREEVERAISSAIDHNFIFLQEGHIRISTEFLPTVRRHLLSDLIASEGAAFPTLIGLAGVAMVPGYGPYHGLLLAELDGIVNSSYRTIWPNGFINDLQMLCTEGLVVLR